MNLKAPISKCLIKRKLVTAFCITLSVAAFATLGDGQDGGDLYCVEDLAEPGTLIQIRIAQNRVQGDELQGKPGNKTVINGRKEQTGSYPSALFSSWEEYKWRCPSDK